MRLTLSIRTARCVLLLAATLGTLLLVGAPVGAQEKLEAKPVMAVGSREAPPSAASPSVRFRLRLVSSKAAPLSATLSIDRGAFRELQGTPGTQATLQEDRRQVRLRSRSQNANLETTLELLLTARGDLAEPISIQLPAAAGGAPSVVSVTLSEIYAGKVSRRSEQNGIVVEMDRLPEDRLRTESKHKSAIFSAGDTYSLTVKAALAGLEPQTPLDLLMQLQRVSDRRVVWQSPSQVTVPADGLPSIDAAIPLPNLGGDYQLRIVATQPAGFRKRFLPLAKNKPLAERYLPIAIRDADPPPGKLTWEPLIDIDPSSARWWERIPSWAWPRRLPWRYRARFSHGSLEVVTNNDKAYVQLPATTGGDPAWQAIPLPVTDPGTPHVLEVEYPADKPQQLVLAMVDSDDQGKFSPLGTAAEVTKQTWGTSTGGTRVYRRVFWPRSQSPLLLVSNGSAGQVARFGRVRLLRAAERLPRKSSPAPLARFSASFDLATLRQTLCANAADRSEAYLAGDYELAQRLADYVEAAGYDSVLLTTRAEAISVAATETSLLEVIAAVFQRRALGLTPVLRFDEPEEGNTFPSQSARQAIVQRVENVLTLLEGNASLKGLGIELNPNGLATLPSERDGATTASVNALLAAYQASWPVEIKRTPATEKELLLGPWKEAYTTWRQQEFTRFYGELSELMLKRRRGSKLLLLADSLVLASELASDLRPTLPTSTEIPVILARRGIVPAELEKHPQLRLVLPKYALSNVPLAKQTLQTRWNELLSEDGTLSQLASLELGHEQAFQLSSFERRSPYGSAITNANFRLATIAETVGDSQLPSNPAWFVDASTCGALTLNEPSVITRQQLSSLPENAQVKLAKTEGPLRINIATADGKSLLFLHNRSPWPLDVSATLVLQAATYSERLTVEAELNQPAKRTFYEAGEHISKLKLPAFGTEVYRFGDENLSGVNCRFEYPAGVDIEFAKRVERLEQVSLNQQRPFNGCGNLSFEQITANGALQDWEALVRSSEGQLSLSSDSPCHGASAVVLAGSQETSRIKLQSKAFAIPETGQLAMTFAVRPTEIDDSAKLIVRFATDDGAYDSFTTIDAAPLQQADSGQWAPFAFGVEDLPTELPSKLRVVFELRGKGELAVDDLQMHSLVYPLECYAGRAAKQKLALLRVIHNAQSSYEARRYDQCRAVFDSYWGQFLLAYVPASPPGTGPSGKRPAMEPPAEPISVAQRPEPPAPASEKQAEAPSFGERMKGYWPSFFR